MRGCSSGGYRRRHNSIPLLSPPLRGARPWSSCPPDVRLGPISTRQDSSPQGPPLRGNAGRRSSCTPACPPDSLGRGRVAVVFGREREHPRNDTPLPRLARVGRGEPAARGRPLPPCRCNLVHRGGRRTRDPMERRFTRHDRAPNANRPSLKMSGAYLTRLVLDGASLPCSEWRDEVPSAAPVGSLVSAAVVEVIESVSRTSHRTHTTRDEVRRDRVSAHRHLLPVAPMQAVPLGMSSACAIGANLKVSVDLREERGRRTIPERIPIVQSALSHRP